MKTLLVTLLGLSLAAGLRAQTEEIRDPATQTLSADQLSELLRPIALYPDPLISLILPASTVPSDIVLADRFITEGGSPDNLDDQPWDSSVKALTRYPETLKWLDANLDWTSQVGDAFSSQEADVMQAIQTLRSKAKAVGNLADTPEQKIVEDEDTIRVVPAQPDAIYVPSYDPEIVYERSVVADRPVYFSVPYSVGPWLNYDCDWHHHRLYRGDWNRGWDYDRHDHHRSSNVFINNNIRNYQVWHVNTQRRRSDARHHGHGLAGRGPVRIHHPVRNAIAQHQGETIRRAVVPDRRGNDEGRGRQSSPPLVRNNPNTIHRPDGDHRRGDHGRGHVAVPRSLPPNLGKSSPRPHFEGPNKSPGRPRSEIGKSQSTPPKMRSNPDVRRDSPGPHVRSSPPQAKKHSQVPKVRSSPQVRKSSPVPRVHSSPQVRKSSPVPKVRSHPQVRKSSPVPKGRSHPQVRKAAPRPKAQPHAHAPVVKHHSAKPDPKKKHR